jgi:hypothetical protein
MKPFVVTILTVLFYSHSFAQSDTLILKDIDWDQTSRASQVELNIPSNKSLLQGFMYKANGAKKHPLLIIACMVTRQRTNLDLAQVARSRGWNVIYFNYRGAWGSQGNFSFENCVQDVVNVVSFCKKYSDSLQIDTFQYCIVWSQYGWLGLFKSITKIASIKKGFALSAWNIYDDTKDVKSESEFVAKEKGNGGDYFVLNTPC